MVRVSRPHLHIVEPDSMRDHHTGIVMVKGHTTTLAMIHIIEALGLQEEGSSLIMATITGEDFVQII